MGIWGFVHGVFYGNLCYFCIKSCVIVMLDRLLDSMDPKSKNLKFEFNFELIRSKGHFRSSGSSLDMAG